MSGSSLHRARQQNLHNFSKKPSTIYGNGRLARLSDPVIRDLTRRDGFFIGADFCVPLFFNPFAPRMGHMMTYGLTRAGKSSSLVIPAALHWDDGSLYITDNKGEVASVAGAYRKERGRIVIEFNPFGINGENRISINPFLILIKDINLNKGRNLHRFAVAISFALLEDNPAEREPFFRKGGRRFLTALILYVAVIEKEKCHLPGLHELVWSGNEKLLGIAQTLKACSTYGGMLKNYGNHLEHLLNPAYPKTFGPMRDHAIDATLIFGADTDFGKALIGNDFDLEDFLQGNVDFYAIFSEDTSVLYGGRFNSIVLAILFVLIGSRPKGPPLMILAEEAGNMAAIPDIDKIMTMLAGKNLRLWFIYQTQKQVVHRYGETVAKLIESQCTFKQLIGVDDPENAKYWSARSGKKTVKTYTLNHDPRDPLTPWKPSVSETERPVLHEGEIMRLPLTKQIISITGQPVKTADVVPFYRVKQWRENARPNPYYPEGYPKSEPVMIDLEKKP